MSKHRSTRDTVSNNFHNNNVDDVETFSPAAALETLHASILRVETLLQVASQAADELRCPSSSKARRAITRMQILIGKAAEEASAVLAPGDKFIAELNRHLEAGGA